MNPNAPTHQHPANMRCKSRVGPWPDMMSTRPTGHAGPIPKSWRQMVPRCFIVSFCDRRAITRSSTCFFFWLPFPFPGSEDRVHLLKRALEAISWRSIEGPSQVKAGAKLMFMLRPWYAYWGGGEVACRVMNASQGLVQDRRTTQVAGRPGRPGQPVAGGRLHQPLARIGHGFHPGGGGRAALQHRSTSPPELHRQVLVSFCLAQGDLQTAARNAQTLCRLPQPVITAETAT